MLERKFLFMSVVKKKFKGKWESVYISVLKKSSDLSWEVFQLFNYDKL